MVSYSLNSPIRRNIHFGIIIFSVVLSYYLYPLFQTLVIWGCNNFSCINSLIQDWAFLGVISSGITTLSIYSFFCFLYNRILWKTKIFHFFHKVPDLNGVWTGTFESMRTESGEDKQVTGPMKLIIKQNWERISCSSQFERSNSHNDITCLDLSDPRGVILKFTYRNESRDTTLGLPEYLGYNEIVIKNKNNMEGSYFTKRVPQTKGIFILVRKIDNDIRETS